MNHLETIEKLMVGLTDIQKQQVRSEVNSYISKDIDFDMIIVAKDAIKKL